MPYNSYSSAVVSKWVLLNPPERDYDTTQTFTAETWYTYTASQWISGVNLTGAKALMVSFGATTFTAAGNFAYRPYGASDPTTQTSVFNYGYDSESVSGGDFSAHAHGLFEPRSGQCMVLLDFNRRLEFRAESNDIGRVFIDVFAIGF